jgi:hypothetical protein
MPTKGLRVRVDGVDYTPEGIEVIRKELAELRAHAINPPSDWHVAVMLSHAIALLSELKDRITEEASKPTNYDIVNYDEGDESP